MRFSFSGIGSVFLQPRTAFPEEVSSAAFVLFPHRITAAEIPLVVEWAASSRAPIFCHQEDIPLLVKEGFGSYRFHGLSGFKELSIEGGRIRFFPHWRKPSLSRPVKAFFWDLMRGFGWGSIECYHVEIRPKSGDNLLYLGSLGVDRVEWEVLNRQGVDVLVPPYGREPDSLPSWCEASFKGRLWKSGIQPGNQPGEMRGAEGP